MAYNHEPPASCPDFNDAISSIERARKINENLRECGQEGWDKFHELESEYRTLDDRNNSLQEQVTELEAIIDAL